MHPALHAAAVPKLACILRQELPGPFATMAVTARRAPALIPVPRRLSTEASGAARKPCEGSDR
jgi:hypothetical protein